MIRAALAHLAPDHSVTFALDTAQRGHPHSFTWRQVGLNIRPGAEMCPTLRTTHATRTGSRLARDREARPGAIGVQPDRRSANASGGAGRSSRRPGAARPLRAVSPDAGASRAGGRVHPTAVPVVPIARALAEVSSQTDYRT